MTLNPTTSLFALTTRGLETISAREIAALPYTAVTDIAYRRVVLQVSGSLAPLLELRTVDDVYLDLATWSGLRHTRDALATIEGWSAQLNLPQAAEICAPLRPIPAQPCFSITASFVGKRNYSSDEIKAAASTGIRSACGWKYTPDDREADFNIRIFIEHDRAYAGLRLSKSPLHERDYKTAQRAGSLKPPVAAAMLHLAAVTPGLRLLDPCCGAGTILIEAAEMGVAAIGGDLEQGAVLAACVNAEMAKLALEVCEWDARALPLADQSLDRIVTNLPWGRQIITDDTLADFYQDVCAEMERIISPEGRIAVLTGTPHLLRFDSLHLDEAIEISLFGQKPTISVFSATR